jgi:SAM-dependent methyltransferase
VPWIFAVIESEHDIQNPTSPEKVRLLGERMRLTAESKVLDVASGRGGPAMILSETFGCHVTCIEKADEFDEAARRRVRERGLEGLVTLVHQDAHDFHCEDEAFDAAMCLGATFIWGGLSGSLDALKPTVRAGGFLAVGEPYWRVWPLPEGDLIDQDWQEGFVTLEATVERVRAASLEPVAIIDSSLDDWDRYESLHWLAAEEWVDANPDDPDAEGIRSSAKHDREAYLRWQRDLLGWAIVVGRKR